jgi:uridine kinase
VIIGISGGSASGKTSFTRRVLNEVDPSYIVHMEHDLYYKNKQDIPEKLLSVRNFDHPDSLDTKLFIEHINKLQKRKPIEQPIYDFTTDTRKEATKLIDSKPIILIEGLLILSIKELRDLMDIKVFIHTDKDLRLMRRILRDIKERGRSVDSVINQYKTTVRPMHAQFVEPSKTYSDIIISGNTENYVGLDLIVTKINSYIREFKKIH